jgi:hypothetical protein
MRFKVVERTEIVSQQLQTMRMLNQHAKLPTVVRVDNLNEEAFIVYFSDDTFAMISALSLANHLPDRIRVGMSDEDAAQYELLSKAARADIM